MHVHTTHGCKFRSSCEYGARERVCTNMWHVPARGICTCAGRSQSATSAVRKASTLAQRLGCGWFSKDFKYFCSFYLEGRGAPVTGDTTAATVPTLGRGTPFRATSCSWGAPQSTGLLSRSRCWPHWSRGSSNSPPTSVTPHACIAHALANEI